MAFPSLSQRTGVLARDSSQLSTTSSPGLACWSSSGFVISAGLSEESRAATREARPGPRHAYRAGDHRDLVPRSLRALEIRSPHGHRGGFEEGRHETTDSQLSIIHSPRTQSVAMASENWELSVTHLHLDLCQGHALRNTSGDFTSSASHEPGGSHSHQTTH